MLSAPDHALEILLASDIRLSELGTMMLGAGGGTIRIYALRGIDLSPQIIVLDKADRLLGVVSGRGMTIRARYEKYESNIRECAQEIETAERKALHERLRHDYGSPVRIDDVYVFDSASGRRGSEPVSGVSRISTGPSGRLSGKQGTYVPEL